ncbi:PREDICTED: hydroxyacid oxidase 2-like [Branchiostoma belcheri]|uniref:(S)-2-hydroxy-acid oxidase n=1 Tax=Branchiostoma belcheri TaxID=7741 RepID=A0A6P4XT76_BRABE|nr:PREDICTED: hydroxyacid oxidase 2-like [Branchiostoma belcheri]
MMAEAKTSPPPRRLVDFEALAERRLPELVYNYYHGWAGDGQTAKDNCAAFKRYRLLTRVLRDVSKQDTSITVLGRVLDLPVVIAPTAQHVLAHDHGEKATAKAAASMNVGMVVSSWTSYGIEEIVAAAPDGVKWFHLTLQKDSARNKALLARAENAGCTAIVLTVDQPVARRLKRTGKLAVTPDTWSLPHMTFDDAPDRGTVSYGEYIYSSMKQPITWDDVEWTKANTSLPVVLKGILSGIIDVLPDVVLQIDVLPDVVLQIDVLPDVVLQIDVLPDVIVLQIDVLPDVVRAVEGRLDVYMDGGVRTGADILKALALGAKCVFVGRPVLWGLAYKGEEGVRQVLQILNDELRVAMAHTGCSNISDITPELLVRETCAGCHVTSKLKICEDRT